MGGIVIPGETFVLFDDAFLLSSVDMIRSHLYPGDDELSLLLLVDPKRVLLKWFDPGIIVVVVVASRLEDRVLVGADNYWVIAKKTLSTQYASILSMTLILRRSEAIPDTATGHPPADGYEINGP